MHGWISLPLWCCAALLIGAVLLGARLGSAPARRKGIALWLAFSLVYAFFALLVAFAYELLSFPGDYDLAAWSMLLVPTLVVVLPAIGIPWVIASSLRGERAVASGADYRVKLLAAFAAVVTLGALVVVGWQPSARRHWMEFILAPRDLTPITGGSDWVCLPGRAFGPHMEGVLDLHFSAIEQKRWQTFHHEGAERPFFDLDHAVGKDLFSAGSYSVESGKVFLDYKVFGENPAAPDGKQASSAAGSDASRMRGSLVLKNTDGPLLETFSLHSLSAEAMTLMAQYGHASAIAFPLSCRRVHADNFHEVPLLDCDATNASGCQPNPR